MVSTHQIGIGAFLAGCGRHSLANVDLAKPTLSQLAIDTIDRRLSNLALQLCKVLSIKFSVPCSAFALANLKACVSIDDRNSLKRYNFKAFELLSI